MSDSLPGTAGTGGVLLPQSVREFLAGGPLAHVVTLGPNGSPHVSMAWVGMEDDEVVIGTLGDQPKLRNLRRDPRIALSFEAPGRNEYFLDHYLVLRGRARVTEGGAPDLLQHLAHTYVGPDVRFPPMPNPPPGFVIRISVDQISGIGDWG
jgi:PPOX class probable F420-dependent enzyme